MKSEHFGVISSARVRHPTSTLDSRGLAELAALREWMDAGCVDTTPVSRKAP